MSKVIVIKDCGDCPYSKTISNLGMMYGICLMKDGIMITSNIDPDKYFPDWCPLPDLPEKRVEEEHNNDESITVDLLAGGWNACLDVIARKVEV